MTDNPRPNSENELAELRRREELYRTLYNSTPVMMHSTDDAGRLAHVNDFWLGALGRVRDEVVGRRLADFLTPASRRRAEDEILPALARDGCLRDEPLQLLKQNGDPIDVLLSAIDRRDEAGRVQSSFFFLVDVTERQRGEQTVALNLSLQRLRNEILTMEGETGWEKIIAAASEELHGLIDCDACGVQLVDLETDSFTVYGAGSGRALYDYAMTPIPGVIRQVVQNGSTLYRRTRSEIAATDSRIDAAIRSIVDAPFVGGTLAINSKEEHAFSERDILILEEFAQVLSTAHRRRQDLRALAHKEEQLRQSQKMEAVGQLTAGIAHNFSNMLAGVSLNLEMALPQAPESLHPALEDALTSAQQAAAMIRELMVFTRSESADFKPVEPRAVIERAVDICHGTFSSKIEILLDCAQDLPPLIGEATQLEQVLLNLCINARDAVEAVAGGPRTIHIAAAETRLTPSAPFGRPDAAPGRYLRVAVRDSGVGIDAATRERLFEPFFTTKEAGKGTGLGLATAYAIVKEHGGWIDCESAIGAGTTFTVYIPVQEEEPAPAPADIRGSETVLLIEDEQLVRDAFLGILQLHGYRVFAVGDGPQGLAVYEREAVDAVMLDLSLPGMPGSEVLSRLRERNPRVKVIVCTGYPAGGQTARTADAVLPKPLRQDDLIRTLRRVLDAPA